MKTTLTAFALAALASTTYAQSPDPNRYCVGTTCATVNQFQQEAYIVCQAGAKEYALDLIRFHITDLFSFPPANPSVAAAQTSLFAALNKCDDAKERLRNASGQSANRLARDGHF